MPTGIQKIPRCEEGGESLVSSKYANLLIDAINGWLMPQISPTANIGKFAVGKETVILDLSVLDQRLRQYESKVDALIRAIDGVSANANCDPNTSAINITISFPNVPNV